MLQSNQVLAFFRPRENCGDWSQRELAEFYRVEDALVKSGVSISTDRGVTDEGEPWFVFYRQDNDEVIVHFARIDGEYVVVSNLTERIVRGHNFQALVRELLKSHPYVLPKTNSRRQTVYLHPATLLAALVVTGYVKSAEMYSGPDEAGRAVEKNSAWFLNRHDLVAFSAIVFAAAWDRLTTDSAVQKFADLAWLDDAKSDSDVAGSASITHDGNENLLLDDFAFQGSQHHILDVSRLASAQGLEQLTTYSTTDASEGWPATLVQVKGLGVSSHSNGSDSTVNSHESSRPEGYGDWKFVGWHSDADAAELTASNVQIEHVVASSKPSNPAIPPASVPTELHGSSSNPQAAVQNTTPPDAIASPDAIALTIIANTLHVDPQTLHPVVLPATNLTDAIQASFLQLNQANGSTDAAAAPLNTLASASSPTATATGAESSTYPVFTDQEHIFDAAAQRDLDAFLRDTPIYRVGAFGRDILIVDTDTSHFPSATLETWTMADGSTLSILGVAAHAHDLAA